MIRIAICEDDSFYLEREKKMIESYLKEKKEKYELSVFSSGVELTNDYRIDYDIIFLDISMEKMDGLDTARWLRGQESKAFIIFLTAYAEYSIEGYKVDAHRYLLKDDEKIELALSECMDSLLEKLHKNDIRVELEVQGGILSIAPVKILYAESKVHRVTIYVLESTGEIAEYYMYNRLDYVQEILEKYGFRRIHQSYLINTGYLKSVCRYKAELTHGICLGISKKYYKEIEDYYIRMRGEF